MSYPFFDKGRQEHFWNTSNSSVKLLFVGSPLIDFGVQRNLLHCYMAVEVSSVSKNPTMQLHQRCCLVLPAIWTNIREILAPIQPPSVELERQFRCWWKSHADVSRLRVLSKFEWCHQNQISIAMAGKSQWKKWNAFSRTDAFWQRCLFASLRKRYDELLADGNKAVQDAIASTPTQQKDHH